MTRYLIRELAINSQAGRTASLNRFDPKYASFGPRAARPRPPAPPPALATFSPPRDKYATVRPPRRADPQPLSAAALDYRSLQRPRRDRDRPDRPDRSDRPDRPDRPDRSERPDRPERQGNARRPRPERHDARDLYAVTEL
ncbi:balbiani ring protein 6-like [Zerene cesonia]|uniref:balbiani ring protein 6-like n=1 Tax=Zerene cesonia TaxID=33412 RepID=UPI0018E5193B|nr:balbiani ring protein 6-like [Zerene cesonia]